MPLFYTVKKTALEALSMPHKHKNRVPFGKFEFWQVLFSAFFLCITYSSQRVVNGVFHLVLAWKTCAKCMFAIAIGKFVFAICTVSLTATLRYENKNEPLRGVFDKRKLRPLGYFSIVNKPIFIGS